MPNAFAFSTLAAPEWPAEVVIERAAAFGYDALEWRGGPDGHVPPSLSAAQLAALARRQRDAGLTALAVTAYSSFVADDAAVRRANLDDLRRHCDTAAALGAQFVRAYEEALPPGARPEALYDRLAEGLAAAAEYAQRVGVALALEPHADFARSAVAAPLLERVPHPALRVIWDVGNAYAAGEHPAETRRRLRARLAYVQLKDGMGRGAAWHLTDLGQGAVPLAWAVWSLIEDGYTGAFSVEWERAWHPELAAAEVALPAALTVLKRWAKQ
ncbi:MAG: sugar phosphate isomerase/epimerase [Anaerolineales bacterium]|nr:sugar phosphate isomerase/epimerase [Anaerolineales bacterium]